MNIQLESLQARLADKKVKLDMSKAALTYLAERGYDPVYGARPLKRLIQHELVGKRGVNAAGQTPGTWYS